MRHRKRTIKLGRTSSHRESLLANMVCSLIASKRIKTTLPKARAARSLAEKMVTLGKQGTLTARRNAISTIRNETSVSELFTSIAPAFKDRNGGYTRILKLGKRASDSSEMVLLEFVNYTAPAAAEPKADPKAEAKPSDKKQVVKKKKSASTAV